MRHGEITELSTPLAQEGWMGQGARELCHMSEKQCLVRSFSPSSEGWDGSTSPSWLGDKDILDHVGPLSGRRVQLSRLAENLSPWPKAVSKAG